MNVSETFRVGPGGYMPAMLVSAWIRPIFLLAVLGAALSPMLLYPLGISGDYPNHLARVYIEHRLAGSAALQEHFTVEWGIYPDLAMDLFMRPLMAVMDPYSAGALFNVLSVAMLPLGVALLSLVTTGRVGLPVAAAVLLIYGKPLAWGFINFVFSSGLALCLLALWIWLRPGWRRTALFVLLMPVLFFSHILGFLLFGFLMLAYEIGQFAASARGRLPQFATRLILRDGLIAVVPLVLFAASFPDRLTGLDTEIAGFGGLQSRLEAFVAPFDYDSSHVSVEGKSLFVCVGLLLVIAFRRGWMTLAPSLRPVFLASVLLVLAVPAAFLGISFLHIRFGAIPVAILLAGASLTPAGRSRAVPLCAAFLGLFALQQVFVHDRMADLDRTQGEIRAAVAELPEGARVLIGRDSLTRDVYRLQHAPALVVIETDGYVANLFTNTSPVGVNARTMPPHRPQAWPLDRNQLVHGARHDPPTTATSDGIQDDFYHGWPQKFDALLWFTEPGGPGPGFPQLNLVASNKMFRLFEIPSGDW
ncbi:MULTISPECIES: hypothetical protein [unclassified Roseovarius]|uniref:hypothetical protein n=1 Tax=unclassified Roseovarius TaxID=2614913 RepID=UPI00273D0A6B|nr:hypothetical protein [Roseovarius sp. MMSF_3350]